MSTHKPIVVVGSVNFDLVARTPRIPVVGETVSGVDFQTFFGGKGANQAVAAARLGARVSLIGQLGDDAFALQLRSGLQEAGVDTSAVGEVPAPRASPSSAPMKKEKTQSSWSQAPMVT